jgi:hypothetical protein
MYLYVCIYMHIYEYTYIYIHSICIFTHTYLYLYIYWYIYKYLHMSTYIYNHTSIYRRSPKREDGNSRKEGSVVSCFVNSYGHRPNPCSVWRYLFINSFSIVNLVRLWYNNTKNNKLNTQKITWNRCLNWRKCCIHSLTWSTYTKHPVLTICI